MNNKSTLNRSETLKSLDKIVDMSDKELGMNPEYIRLAVISAHTHIIHLRSDLEKKKRQLKSKPKSDPIPLPTIKPGDKVRHEMHGYGTAHVTFKDSKNVLVAFNKCQHAVIVSAEELEVVE